MTEPVAEDGTEAAETEEAPVFENRAARRAKGKGSGQKLGATGQSQMRSGTVQSPRQYGNRRSG